MRSRASGRRTVVSGSADDEQARSLTATDRRRYTDRKIQKMIASVPRNRARSSPSRVTQRPPAGGFGTYVIHVCARRALMDGRRTVVSSSADKEQASGLSRTERRNYTRRDAHYGRERTKNRARLHHHDDSQFAIPPTSRFRNIRDSRMYLTRHSGVKEGRLLSFTDEEQTIGSHASRALWRHGNRGVYDDRQPTRSRVRSTPSQPLPFLLPPYSRFSAHT